MKVLRLFVVFCLMLASFYGSAQDNTYTATYNDYSLDYHKINDICAKIVKGELKPLRLFLRYLLQ